MTRLLIRCYPGRWRERYGDEFEALLEERSLGPFDVADILVGALDARLRERGLRRGREQEEGVPMALRIGGLAAILGALLWPIAYATSVQSAFAVAPLVPPLVGLIGSVAMLVALTSLSAHHARTSPALAWAAFIVPAVGALVCLVGVVGLHVTGATAPLRWGSEFFVFFALGALTAFVGSMVFAIGTYRFGLSAPGTLVLGVGAALSTVAVLNVSDGLFMVAASIFCAGWLMLGVRAISDRPVTTLRPI